jgi:acyl-CoA thioester hydrolase
VHNAGQHGAARAAPQETGRAKEELCALLRVRFSEVDAQGLVFNSRYLEYIDAGFTEFMRARGILVADALDRDRFDTVLVKATLEYQLPARLD